MMNKHSFAPVLVVTQFDSRFEQVRQEYERYVPVVRFSLNYPWEKQIRGHTYSRVIIDMDLDKMLEQEPYGQRFYTACKLATASFAQKFGVPTGNTVLSQCIDVAKSVEELA